MNFLRSFLFNLSFLLFAIVFISLFYISCTPSPYLRSTLFEEVGLETGGIQFCTAVVTATDIEYFICEPYKKNYQIKIVPSAGNRATMIVILDSYPNSGSIESIINKDLQQFSISGEYFLHPKPNIANSPKNYTKMRLSFRSLPSEKYATEALFVVDKYIYKNSYERDKPRVNPK